MGDVSNPAGAGKVVVTPKVDPLFVICPYCGADSEEQCFTSDRGGVNVFMPRAPHAARVKSAASVSAKAAPPPSVKP